MKTHNRIFCFLFGVLMIYLNGLILEKNGWSAVQKISISKRLDLEMDPKKWEWFKSTTFYEDGLWIIRKKGQIQPQIYFRYDLSHLQKDQKFDEETLLKKVCDQIAAGPTMTAGKAQLKILPQGKMCWATGKSLIPGKGQIRMVWIAPFGQNPLSPPVYLTHQAVMHFKDMDEAKAEAIMYDWITAFKVVAP